MELELYQVLLDEDTAVDPRRYGKELSDILGNTALEARMLIRKARGIFLEDLDRDRAQKVADMLRRGGISARAVAATEIPPFPQPVRAVEIARAGEALRIRCGSDEEPAVLPWADLGAVIAGAVALPAYSETFSSIRFDQIPALRKLDDPETRDLLRENLILKMELPTPEPPPATGDQTRSAFELIEERWPGKVRVYADLVGENLRSWNRVAMDDFAYTTHAGSVKLGGAWGFTRFFQDIQQMRPQALRPMTLKLAAGGDIRALVFPRIEDFHRYSTWEALRFHFQGASPCPQSSSSPSPAPADPSTGDVS